MNTPDLTHAPWKVSSYSSGQGECVEVAQVAGIVAARDSKNRQGPALTFPRDSWRDFLHGVIRDDFQP